MSLEIGNNERRCHDTRGVSIGREYWMRDHESSNVNGRVQCSGIYLPLQVC